MMREPSVNTILSENVQDAPYSPVLGRFLALLYGLAIKGVLKACLLQGS